MLNDWTYWLSSIHPVDLLWMMLPLALFDTPRYFLSAFLLWTFDTFEAAISSLRRMMGKVPDEDRQEAYPYRPTVCVVIAGLNEGPSLANGLRRLIGAYPKLQIIVVDDGSSDQMTAIGQHFARLHDNILVLTKPRGGKSSAMNYALPFTTAEVVIVLDADSHLSASAIWEVVQPLADPEVGAVSGNVLVRNAFEGLCTRCQAVEYQRSVFLGRIVSSRLELLGIASGAFGAFRRTALTHVGGWDVGPGEDEDITLRLRRVGYRIAYAPYAECWTDAPSRWGTLTQQRRRWEWAVVTFELRKHIDMANVLSPAARLIDAVLVYERWLFNILLPIWFWVYLLWLFCAMPISTIANLSLLYYLVYLLLDLLHWIIVLDYSAHKRRDLQLSLILPLMPFYQLYQRCVTSWAVCEELISRRSFRDTFVPEHVRRATWHW